MQTGAFSGRGSYFPGWQKSIFTHAFKAVFIFAVLLVALAVIPKTAFADEPYVKVVYLDGTAVIKDADNSTMNPLADAIDLANKSGDTNPVVKLELSAGLFAANGDGQFRITKENLVIEGISPGTEIDCSTYKVSGQAGILVAANGVTISNLHIGSTAEGAVSALKVSMIGDETTLPLVYGFTINNVTLYSQDGHGLNIHGVQGATVDGVTVIKAGKVGISLASATGVTIKNTKTLDVDWGDVAVMYGSGPAYAIPTEARIVGDNNSFQKDIIYSERPVSAQDGPDRISGDNWVLTAGTGDAVSRLVPISPTTQPQIVDSAGMHYLTFADACKFAPNGALLKLLQDVVGPLVVPGEAAGKTLCLDGAGHTVSGGLNSAVELASIELNNINFKDGGITLDLVDAIQYVNIERNTFTGTLSMPAISVEGLDEDSVIVIKRNVFDPGSFGSTEKLVSMSLKSAGTPPTDKPDLTRNYWMGSTPSYSGPDAQLFPYYQDRALTILVYEGEDPIDENLDFERRIDALSDSSTLDEINAVITDLAAADPIIWERMGTSANAGRFAKLEQLVRGKTAPEVLPWLEIEIVNSSSFLGSVSASGASFTAFLGLSGIYHVQLIIEDTDPVTPIPEDIDPTSILSFMVTMNILDMNGDVVFSGVQPTVPFVLTLDVIDELGVFSNIDKLVAMNYHEGIRQDIDILSPTHSGSSLNAPLAIIQLSPVQIALLAPEPPVPPIPPVPPEPPVPPVPPVPLPTDNPAKGLANAGDASDAIATSLLFGALAASSLIVVAARRFARK